MFIITITVPVLIFLFSFFSRYEEPLHTEEIHFVEAVSSIRSSWIPKYELWLTHINPDTFLEEKDDTFLWTMWHPPLYQYFMSFFTKIFHNYNLESTIRIFQLLLMLSSLCLIFYSTKKEVGFLKKTVYDNNFLYFFACLAFTLFNPFVIQSILLIDIDNNMLFFCISLFLFFLFRLDNNLVLRKCFILSVLFCFTLWAKLTTPLLLPFIVLFYYLNNFKFKTAILNTFFISFLGFSLFIATFFLFCEITSAPFYQPIIKTFGSALFEGFLSTNDFNSTQSFNLKVRVGEFIKYCLYFPIWISSAGLVFILFQFIKFRNNKFRKNNFNQFLLFIFGFLIIVGYGFIRPFAFEFPKYQGFAVAILLLVSSKMYLNQIAVNKKILFQLFIFIIPIIFLIYLNGDQLLNFQRIKTNQFYYLIFKLIISNSFFLTLIVLTLLFVNRLERKSYSSLKNLELSVFIIAFLSFSNTSILHGTSSYSTVYFYGENNEKRNNLIDYLSSENFQNDIVFGRKDIGYLSNGPQNFIQVDDYFKKEKFNIIKFNNLVKKYRPKFLVISLRRSELSSADVHRIKNILENINFKSIRNFGDFILFRNYN